MQQLNYTSMDKNRMDFFSLSKTLIGNSISHTMDMWDWMTAWMWFYVRGKNRIPQMNGTAIKVFNLFMGPYDKFLEDIMAI